MAIAPKRPRAKRSPTAEGTTLFGAGLPQVMVLSSNFTIGPLLARGALLPDPLEGDALSAAEMGLDLRWSVGPLPAEWIAALLASARNVIPIAIRLRRDRGVRRLLLPNVAGAVEAICLSDVEGLLFRSEKERDRFEGREFLNYDLTSLGARLGIEPSLFEGTAGHASAPSMTDALKSGGLDEHAAESDTQSTTTSDVDYAIRTVRAADSLTGLLAFLLTGSPGSRAWMHGVQRLFAKKARGSSTTWPERLASAAIGVPVDAPPAERALLNAIVDVLRRYPVEGGWPSEQVLTEIAVQAKGRLESHEESAVKDLDRWALRANDVLASRAEPQSLADDGFVLQRAALLLLLRGDLVGLASGDTKPAGAQLPGPLVRGTAGALAAMRTGLRGLPARYKMASDMGAPGHWLEYLGEIFVAQLQAAGPSGLVPPSFPTPTLTYRPIRTLQGEWIASIASREVGRTQIEVNRGLERLLARGLHLGFEFQEHGDNGLLASVSCQDGRTRPVYLELIRTDQDSEAMVRFSAPALRVMGVSSRTRLTRDLAFDLLKRNADPRMNCRFAINDDATEVLVLVDQLLATLDDAEFMQHIQHVAKTAADFELSLNVGSVSAS